MDVRAFEPTRVKPNWARFRRFIDVWPSKPKKEAATSIIIRAFNPGPELDFSLGLIQQPTKGAVEIVVVDDGSTAKASRQALADLNAEGLRVVRRDVTGGPCLAYNDGLAIAAGTDVLCLEAGDRLYPDAISAIVQARREDPSARITLLSMAGAGRAPLPLPDADFLYANPEALRYAVMRRADVEAVGGFRRKRSGAAMVDLVLRLVEAHSPGAVGTLQEPSVVPARDRRTVAGPALRAQREYLLRNADSIPNRKIDFTKDHRTILQPREPGAADAEPAGLTLYVDLLGRTVPAGALDIVLHGLDGMGLGERDRVVVVHSGDADDAVLCKAEMTRGVRLVRARPGDRLDELFAADDGETPTGLHAWLAGDWWPVTGRWIAPLRAWTRQPDVAAAALMPPGDWTTVGALRGVPTLMVRADRLSAAGGWDPDGLGTISSAGLSQAARRAVMQDLGRRLGASGDGVVSLCDDAQLHVPVARDAARS